jgi:hypothetical protein
MIVVRLGTLGPVLLSATFLCAGVASGQAPAPPVTALPEEPPEAPGPELAGDRTRFAAFGGVAWTSLDGTEVPKADPAPAFELGAFFRVIGSVSVWGAFASDSHEVFGQLASILDQHVRADARSGRVEAEVRARKLRAGLRVDAIREPAWRVVPYLVAAASFAKVEATIDAVDFRPPAPVPDAEGRLVDISKLEQSHTGGFGRVGLEYRLGAALRADVHGSFEVLEFPAGTSAQASAGGGVAFRF